MVDGIALFLQDMMNELFWLPVECFPAERVGPEYIIYTISGPKKVRMSKVFFGDAMLDFVEVSGLVLLRGSDLVIRITKEMLRVIK